MQPEPVRSGLQIINLIPVYKFCIYSLALLVLVLPAHTETIKIYTVGVVPQFETYRLHNIWKPILQQLEKETGQQFVLKGAPSIPAFEQALLAGEYDFAYMNPYQLILSQQTEKYHPLLRDHSKKLQGILVIRKDSTIKNISELDGQTIAFPAPNALGASLLIRADLIDMFNINIKTKYVNSHDSVYLNVLLNQVIAGGGVQKTLAQQPAQVSDSLKVLHRTRKIAPHPFAVHPGVDDKLAHRVREVLMQMGTTDSGKEQLKKIPIKQIGAASLGDYKDLINMNLERFSKDN